MMRGLALLAVLFLPAVAAHGGLDDGHPTDSAAVPVPFLEASRLGRDGRTLDVNGVRLSLGTNGTHLFLRATAPDAGWIVVVLGPGHAELREGPGGTVVDTHYAVVAATSGAANATTGDLVASQPADVRGRALEIDADLHLLLVANPDPRVALDATLPANRTRLAAQVPLSWLGMEPRGLATIGLYAGNDTAAPPGELSKAVHQRLLVRALLLGPDDDEDAVARILRRDAVPWTGVAFLVALSAGAWFLAFRRR